jgi:hypothetical protein
MATTAESYLKEKQTGLSSRHSLGMHKVKQVSLFPSSMSILQLFDSEKLLAQLNLAGSMRDRVKKSLLLEYLSDRVREAEDRMKRIADRVYKVGRRSDEADSRSGIQSR